MLSFQIIRELIFKIFLRTSKPFVIATPLLTFSFNAIYLINIFNKKMPVIPCDEVITQLYKYIELFMIHNRLKY